MAVTGIGRSRSDSRGTSSVTFRLRPDEIRFLKSIANEGITEGLRRLIIFGRAAGNLALQEGANSVVYALIARVEKLEAQMRSQNG